MDEKEIEYLKNWKPWYTIVVVLLCVLAILLIAR